MIALVISTLVGINALASSQATGTNVTSVESIPAIAIGGDLQSIRKGKLFEEASSVSMMSKAAQYRLHGIEQSGFVFLIHESLYMPKQVSSLRILLNEAKFAGVPTIIDSQKSPETTKALRTILRTTRLGGFSPSGPDVSKSVSSAVIGVSVSGQLVSKGQTYDLTWRSFEDMPPSNWPSEPVAEAEDFDDEIKAEGDGFQIAFSKAVPISFRNELGKRILEITIELQERQNVPLRNLEAQIVSEFMQKFAGKPNWSSAEFRTDSFGELGTESLLTAMKRLPLFKGQDSVAEATFRAGVIRNLKAKLMFTVKTSKNGHSLRTISLDALLRG